MQRVTQRCGYWTSFRSFFLFVFYWESARGLSPSMHRRGFFRTRREEIFWPSSHRMFQWFIYLRTSLASIKWKEKSWMASWVITSKRVNVYKVRQVNFNVRPIISTNLKRIIDSTACKEEGYCFDSRHLQSELSCFSSFTIWFEGRRGSLKEFSLQELV